MVARYGDIIAQKTGLGGAWIGLVLLALVTSLPEAFTGISAVTLAQAPDLTIGDLFGANTFNLLNLAILDIAYRNGSLFAAVSSSHRLIGWFSLILVTIAAAAILISNQFPNASIAWIGWYTPVIIVLYLILVRQIFRIEQRQPTPQLVNQTYSEIPMKKVYRNFAISAAIIIGAGIWLALLGKEIAMVTGWEQSFVGSLLLGFTTSLPEITVSFTAMRIGAVDLAVANMIGSNLFNMTIIPIDDLFYRQGPVLAAVSTDHLLTAFTVIVMTGIFIAGLRFKPRRVSRLSWCSGALITVFIISAYFRFTLG